MRTQAGRESCKRVQWEELRWQTSSGGSFLGQGWQGKWAVSFIRPIGAVGGGNLLNTRMRFLVSEIEASAFKTK